MTIAFEVAEAAAPLFADSYAVDANHNWVFGSFWGHETILQEFMARLTIPNHEDGLNSFSLKPIDGGRSIELLVGKVNRLSRYTAKTPASTITGALCHTWMFDKALTQPDQGKREGYVLASAQESQSQLLDRAWTLVETLCPLPLLSHWRSIVLPVLFEQEWITELTGYGMQGFRVRLPDEELDQLISEGVRTRRLTLEESETSGVN